MYKYTFCILLLVSMITNAQYFSGELTYKTTIVAKNDSVDIAEIIEAKHGTTSKYVITASHYKATYFKNGKYNYSYTYDDQTKRMYDDYSDKPYLTFRDSQRFNYEYFGSKVYKDSTIQVLDKTCFMVASEAEYGTSKTYYSDDIKVDYAAFEGHKVGNWYNKLKEVDGCIMIKSITELKNHFEIMEAIEIVERPVALTEFGLPNKPVAASYTALDGKVELENPSSKSIKCYREKVGALQNKQESKYTAYISFLLTKEGEQLYYEPVEEDEKGYAKTAIDILQNCGFQFTPGKINGTEVDSQVYFPVSFND